MINTNAINQIKFDIISHITIIGSCLIYSHDLTGLKYFLDNGADINFLFGSARNYANLDVFKFLIN